MRRRRRVAISVLLFLVPFLVVELFVRLHRGDPLLHNYLLEKKNLLRSGAAGTSGNSTSSPLRSALGISLAIRRASASPTMVLIASIARLRTGGRRRMLCASEATTWTNRICPPPSSWAPPS